MTFAPVTFTRIDADHYIVGAVHLLRIGPESPVTDGTWGAYPHGDTNERPLFTAPDLAGILDMAHGAVEMMRPA